MNLECVFCVIFVAVTEVLFDVERAALTGCQSPPKCKAALCTTHRHVNIPETPFLKFEPLIEFGRSRLGLVVQVIFPGYQNSPRRIAWGDRRIVVGGGSSPACVEYFSAELFDLGMF
jgi:hypothetical protein